LVEQVMPGTAISSPPNFWRPVAAHHPARAPHRYRSTHRLLLLRQPSSPEPPRAWPAPSGASFVGTGAPAVTDGPVCSFVSVSCESASPNLSLRGADISIDPPRSSLPDSSAARWSVGCGVCSPIPKSVGMEPHSPRQACRLLV
jgi:hypothetical protein